MQQIDADEKRITDSVESAIAAGLTYIRWDAPGIRRRRAGKGFCFVGPNGKPLRDDAHLKRIRSLAIPPAWTDVWICASANGHLQAIGYDARGRRQYRYHPLFRSHRNETKFEQLPAFARSLPSIRERVNADLKLPGLPREKVLATVVRLLETTFIRVGNLEYAKQNESFGLTTLRNRHVDVDGSTVRFRFRGKSGVNHEVEVKDRRLARIIKACHDLPGYSLFEYLDDAGGVRTITSGDVNTYLKEVSGQDFTAKHFRTWAGTVQTALALAAIGPAETATETKHNVIAAIKVTAQRLGNRPATCRNYYVHPAVLNAYADGTLTQILTPRELSESQPTSNTADLYPEEICVLKLIEGSGVTDRKAA